LLDIYQSGACEGFKYSAPVSLQIKMFKLFHHHNFKYIHSVNNTSIKNVLYKTFTTKRYLMTILMTYEDV